MRNRQPFPDDILSLLEKDEPDLISRYRQKMSMADQELADAKKAQEFGQYADVAGQAFSDFGNANRKDVILKNRMQDLGRKPEVIEAKQDQYRPSAPAFDKQVENARQARNDVASDFVFAEKTRAQNRLNDPNSEDSKTARAYLRQIAPKSTAFEGFDRLSAAQVKELAPGLFKAYDAEAERASRESDRAATRDQTRALREQTQAIQASKDAEKKTEKMEQLRVGDLGYAQTPDDAKQLKQAFESKASFDNRLNELIALREKHGGGALLNREDIGRAKQLSKDLLLQYKDMAKLGVLSQSDEAILNAIIPDDPLQFNSPLAALQGQDPTLFKLKKFKEDAAKDFDTRVKNRLRGGETASTTKPAGKVFHGSNLPD